MSVKSGAVLGRGPKRTQLLIETLDEYYTWVAQEKPQPQPFFPKRNTVHASEEDPIPSEGTPSDGTIKGRKDKRIPS